MFREKNNESDYPRRLTNTELELLWIALPVNKPGYNKYRQKIETLFVVGLGRFGAGNFILADKDGKPDNTLSSAPVLAIAEAIYPGYVVNIAVHEEQEDKIEIDLRNSLNVYPVDKNETIVSGWTYSNWTPGDKAPKDNSSVREIHLIKNEIVLVIAKAHKKIWCYEASTGVNYLIPVTNFYNEIMRVKQIRDPKIALDQHRIFEKPEEFSDEEIGQGFLLYNKFSNRMHLNYDLFKKEQGPKGKRSIWNLFRSGR